MKAKITFTEPVLGTKSGNKELTTEFIAAKHPDGVQADEAEVIDSMDESLEKASTIFHKEDGKPFIWDYQIKGFFKSACLAMIETDTMTKKELSDIRLSKYLHKRTIDKMIFVNPRKIFLNVNGEATICERPLRGETMRGERIALARSEQLAADTTFEIEIICLNKKLEQFLPQWLTYGALFGLGQWRSSGMGRFEWEEIK